MTQRGLMEPESSEVVVDFLLLFIKKDPVTYLGSCHRQLPMLWF